MAESIHVAILDLLPMRLGTRALFPVAVLALLLVLSLALTFSGTATVEKARLAVNTVVDIRHPLVRVIADNVLPCLTPFTEDRASIIFIKGTDAFDGVRLFLVRRDRVRDCAISDWGARRSGDRIRIRGGVRDGEGGGICHSPTDYPLSNHNKMKYERSDAGANPSPFKEHIHKRNTEISVCRGQAAEINIQTRSRRSRRRRILATNSRGKGRVDRNDLKSSVWRKVTKKKGLYSRESL